MGGASKFLMLLHTPFPRLCSRSSFFRVARHSHVPLAFLSGIAGAEHRLRSSTHPLRRGFQLREAEHVHTQTSARVNCGELSASSPSLTVYFHPWPDWSKLMELLTACGYADRQVSSAHGDDDDSFSVPEELPEDFRKLAGACLLYARERSDLLRLLSRKDIKVVVENGSPFIFKNALNSVRRMKSFIGSDGNDVLQSEQACTLDVMRYLLSYACGSLTSIGGDDTKCRELVELSVRNLLCELVKIGSGSRASNIDESTSQYTPFGFEQSPKPLRQNMEMKRGDWICPKCNFMNFARNMKCLECDETRPKRQLNGGEWECPQCDFFNYGRNMTCLRCDCKRPGEISSNSRPSIEQLVNSGSADRAEIERRLAENDEKAERWFSKVSQLDDSSDLSRAIADEDFPEIMPLRKGMNRFVTSSRKTPLERRLANARHGSTLGNGVSCMGNDSLGKIGSDKMSESAINQTLDRILGRSSATSGTNLSAASGTRIGSGNQSVGGDPHTTANKNSGYASFVPLSANIFHKSQNAELLQTSESLDFASVKADQPADNVPRGSGSGKENESFHSGGFSNLIGSETASNETLSSTVKDVDLMEGWPERSAQLPEGVANLQSAASDNGFPKIMPMHEDKSRPDNSNRRDHSLTTPHYKRRIAMEQANNFKFVPFVPFPPDYLAKKDRQPEAGSSTEKSATEASASVAVGSDRSIPQQSEGIRLGYSNLAGDRGIPQTSEEFRLEYSSQGGASNIVQKGRAKTSGDILNKGLSEPNMGERKVVQQTNNVWTNNAGSSPGGRFSREGTADITSASDNFNQNVENPQKRPENWNHGFTGKSLEGSAVTEPDPLDMSEEAKAQRWFRRVAQIKDISELSKIPDEDFPEIMPMRKGVNRFVVSKRKTPLERRLTSPQYRRNLPIMRSEPGKDSTKE